MMSNENKYPMPVTITPFLVVKNGAKAVEFYTAGLGATKVYQDVGPDGRVNAQLSIAGANFYIADEEPEFGNLSPETIGGSPVRMILIVSEPEAVFARALGAGAKQICPVTTGESWKIGKLMDPFGHTWEIGHPLNAE